MTGILIAGTSSDAGKSLVTTGICRALSNRGLRIAPYKAQNMSNNSMVCADGSEIGRAQYLQALAARVEPTSAMNPVLLKPGTDRRSFIVLRGEPGGVLESGDYATGRKHLAEAAWAAFDELAATHDFVVCEGAGSPAEINLRQGDYVNMGLARRFNLPTVLVGDIDRGGVLASIYGAWALLSGDDQVLLKAYIINKFRGDPEVLAPGLDEISARTGLTNLGVLPWLSGVWLDGEDALDLGRWRHELTTDGVLRIAVVQFPRVSNATDVDPLAYEEGIDITMTASPQAVADADLVVLPGSRSTIDDLAWLREIGIAAALAARAAAGRPILGICGGYQMLASVIDDPHGVESGKPTTVDGLGLLDSRVVFHEAKTLGRPRGQWRGTDVEGYEIHHGVVEPITCDEVFLDGMRQGPVFGTMWHGALECDDFRQTFLAEVASIVGSSWTPTPGRPGYGDAREAMIEKLADAVETHLDLDVIIELATA